MILTLEKYAEESRLYEFDFSAQSEIVAGQLLTGLPVITTLPTGLACGAPTLDGTATKVRVLVSAGQEGITYFVKCVVSTSGTNIVLVGAMKIAIVRV